MIAHATVEAEDAEWAGPWRWLLHRRSGTPRRRARRPDGRWGTAYLRREILGLEPGDRRHVIHLNGDPLDCRRSNLRAVTVSEVAQRRTARRGSSPYRNVRFDRRAGKWRADVTLNRRRVHLGSFDDPAEAARVAADWRREHMPYTDGGTPTRLHGQMGHRDRVAPTVAALTPRPSPARQRGGARCAILGAEARHEPGRA